MIDARTAPPALIGWWSFMTGDHAMTEPHTMTTAELIAELEAANAKRTRGQG